MLVRSVLLISLGLSVFAQTKLLSPTETPDTTYSQFDPSLEHIGKPELLTKGQSSAEISKNMGSPNSIIHRNKAHASQGLKDENATWLYNIPAGYLAVTFVDGKVTKIKPHNTSSGEPRGAAATAAIADIATRLYLIHYCPQVRTVPLLLMNANQRQFLQTCVAWGY